MIGANGERLFEQQILGSMSERVARGTTRTVI
jgi:hypothetical protein